MQRPWLDDIENHTALDPLLGRLKAGAWKAAEGAWGSSAHLLGGVVARRTGRPVLLVVGHLDSADEAVDDLDLFEGLSVAAFPALEVLPGESGVSRPLMAERLRLAQKLSESSGPGVLVAPVQALMQSVPDPTAPPQWIRTLKTSEAMDPQDLVEWLVDADYRRVDSVEEVGDFAVRGGLIDILPEDEPPVRLEFFGDRIESIMEFDFASLAPDRKRRQVALLSNRLDAMGRQDNVGLWTLLDPATVVVYAESMEVFEQARGYYERLNDPVGIFAPQTVQKKLQAYPVISFDPVTPEVLSENPIRLPIGSLQNFDRHAHLAVSELGRMIEDGAAESVVVLCRREAEKQRLEQLIGEHAAEHAGRIVLESGSLQRGFVWDGAVAVVPHQELFHRHELRRRVRRVGREGGAEVFFDIEPGDYVVHRDHGIARFKSLRLMDKGPDDPGQEYLSLEFAGRALLHVPVTQIDRVQKYVGGAGRPSLSKLGGGRW
ncbi:MAG: CarD family transcriptional regulator, partial [Phycisphaeraceae bacterium]|nr:CarD family transcriptional regulator [Phycisphaeraceae bacterium]